MTIGKKKEKRKSEEVIVWMDTATICERSDDETRRAAKILVAVIERGHGLPHSAPLASRIHVVSEVHTWA